MMKTQLRFLLISFLTLVLMTGQAFSRENLENLIFESNMSALDEIVTRKENIEKQNASLEKIENNLRRTKKGQNIYLKFESMAGSLLLIGVIIGSYKAYFPPGMRAMAGAYVTVTGLSHGLVRLNQNEVQSLLLDIVRLRTVLEISRNNLQNETRFYCKQVLDYHSLCY